MTSYLAFICSLSVSLITDTIDTLIQSVKKVFDPRTRPRIMSLSPLCTNNTGSFTKGRINIPRICLPIAFIAYLLRRRWTKRVAFSLDFYFQKWSCFLWNWTRFDPAYTSKGSATCCIFPCDFKDSLLKIIQSVRWFLSNEFKHKS